MRKILTYGLLIVAFTLQLAGCSNTPKDTIKETAYNWLNERNQMSIIDSESANIKAIKFDTEHIVENQIENSINIQDKETYQVTFTTNDEILGPIVVYVDKDNLEVLGMDYRD